MTNMKRLVPTQDLKINRLRQISRRPKGKTMFVYYDEAFDAVIFRFVDPTVPTTVHYVDDIALLYDDQMQIIGFQVEDVTYTHKGLVDGLPISDKWGQATADDAAGKLVIGTMARTLIQMYRNAVHNSQTDELDEELDILGNLDLRYA